MRTAHHRGRNNKLLATSNVIRGVSMRNLNRAITENELKVSEPTQGDPPPTKELITCVLYIKGLSADAVANERTALHDEARLARQKSSGCLRFDVVTVHSHGPNKLDTPELLAVQAFSSPAQFDAFAAVTNSQLKQRLPAGAAITEYFGAELSDCFTFGARWKPRKIDPKDVDKYKEDFGVAPLSEHVKTREQLREEQAQMFKDLKDLKANKKRKSGHHADTPTGQEEEDVPQTQAFSAEQDDMRRVAVVVLTEVKEERHADELVELMTKAARDSCREPGCLRYDVLRDRHNPKSFLFYEVYASEEDFEHHKRLPHTKNWGKFKFRDLPPPNPPPDYKPPENPDNPIVSDARTKYPPTLVCEMIGDQFTWCTMASIQMATSTHTDPSIYMRCIHAGKRAYGLQPNQSWKMRNNGTGGSDVQRYATTKVVRDAYEEVRQKVREICGPSFEVSQVPSNATCLPCPCHHCCGCSRSREVHPTTMFSCTRLSSCTHVRMYYCRRLP